jgi:hypothetical protein
MYDEGRFTGFLNALDPISPHCSVTVWVARDWHRVASEYLDAWGDR